jgi:hypothetical protein
MAGKPGSQEAGKLGSYEARKLEFCEPPGFIASQLSSCT